MSQNQENNCISCRKKDIIIKRCDRCKFNYCSKCNPHIFFREILINLYKPDNSVAIAGLYQMTICGQCNTGKTDNEIINEEIEKEKKQYYDEYVKIIGDKNYYPLTTLHKLEMIEGYWYDTFESYVQYKKHTGKEPDNDYPYPNPTDKQVDKKFLEKLEDLINKEMIDCTTYTTPSKCRLCNKNNGDKEYRFINQEDIIFTLPEGMIHYYKEHNVQPSKEFVEYINNYEANSILAELFETEYRELDIYDRNNIEQTKSFNVDDEYDIYDDTYTYT